MLTPHEKEAVQQAGRLYTFIERHVVKQGACHEADLAEIAHHIHGIQHAIMAQSAVRAGEPGEFRFLGLDLVQSVLQMHTELSEEIGEDQDKRPDGC